MAGNALAVNDLEAALFQTALGQEIYSKTTRSPGALQTPDAINRLAGGLHGPAWKPD
jgi:hypothetical protein